MDDVLRRADAKMDADGVGPDATTAGKEYAICRWLAYSGTPVPRRAAALQAEALADRAEPALAAGGGGERSGDGFGIGWYGIGDKRRASTSRIETA